MTGVLRAVVVLMLELLELLAVLELLVLVPVVQVPGSSMASLYISLTR